ncbi:phospholipase D-like domain-containing protein [Leptospira wolffii]|uniref:phospholipase D-like domain-containing protein n=1 Tax=Leptospira wolffii TaxID=409998 RepID=UPI0002DBF439|nr:phospholipase D-like domain-containing protein [Leptospira wolffii]EPG66524.1 PLD-like domain protein [Leptospira wolffii serovar Khorat str. Khorat-H2]
MKGIRYSIFLFFLLSCSNMESTLSLFVSDLEYPKAFFSYPGRFTPEGKKRNVRDEILRIIRETEHEIYMQVYSFNDPEIESELLDSVKRGIKLEIEGEWGKDYPMGILPFLSYWKGTGLHHTKVLVSDKTHVFLGTGNFTYYGLERDLNGYIEFLLPWSQSEDFRLFLEEKYSFPVFQIGCLEFRNSPKEGFSIQNRFLNSIESSKERIDYLIFDHYDPIMSIGMAASRSVGIRGIYDRPVDPEGKILSRLGKFKIYEDGNEDRLDDPEPGKGGLLHHKSMMLDGVELLTGSYNFSASARDSNREISVRTKHDRLVTDFKSEFERILAYSSVYEERGSAGIDSFWIDSVNRSLCRSGSSPEEALLDLGSGWFRWRNFYKWKEGESCRKISEYETVSSRYIGGKTEFPTDFWEDLGARLYSREGRILLSSEGNGNLNDFYLAIRKPAFFLRPDSILFTDSAWIFPPAADLEEISNAILPMGAWILSRGKVPEKANVSISSGVYYLSLNLPANSGLILLEYEDKNLYFCYKSLGYSLNWADQILYSVWEMNRERFPHGISKQESDFFGEAGAGNRRRSNLCGIAF